MVEPDEIKGSFDSGDPNTTNLYLGNLNPKVMYNIFVFSKKKKIYHLIFKCIPLIIYNV